MTFEPITVRELIAFNAGVDAVLMHVDMVVNAMRSASISEIHRRLVSDAFKSLISECEGCKLVTDPVDPDGVEQ
jgi:hypothetical protein